MKKLLDTIFGRRTAQKEKEAHAIKQNIIQNAREAQESIDTLNRVLRDSAAYRIAMASGKKL